MNLAPMRFKNYVWPHNPRIYEIEFDRRVAVNKVPFGRYNMKNLGMGYRILRGEGEFAGEGAYDEFKKLATVFYEDTPGILVHPVWQSANAWFVSLALKMEPLEDYVSYTFEFWECYDAYNEGLVLVREETAQTEPASSAASDAEKHHTVKNGETLWAIAAANGISLTGILKLNPQIKNPAMIKAGEKIRISGGEG